MDNQVYDVAVIGTGPAGLSAAITLKIRNKNVIIFGSERNSGKLIKAHEINNYLGFPKITGEELGKRFSEHLKALDIEVNENIITTVYNMSTEYGLLTRENRVIKAKSVIIATGVNFGTPYPNEDKYLGKGVSYCATCDAFAYKGKIVAVIGASPKEESEAKFLAEVADKVYYIPLYKTDTNEFDKIKEHNNIIIINEKPVSICGENKVTGLDLEKSHLDVEGVFILRDSIAPSKLVPGLELDGNHIKVNRKMETNLSGCFACGDVVGLPYQYIKAAGEGNVAALSAVEYINN